MDATLVRVTERGKTFQVVGFIGDHLTNSMMGGRIYESNLLNIVYEMLGTGGVYYDFGACIGTHTLFFSIVCEADLVVAVEPNPAAFPLLRKGIELNGCQNVEAYPVAAGDVAGRCLVVGPGGNMGGFVIEMTDSIAGSVPMLPSEALITAPPKLIKVDCEDSTIKVLRGAEEAIRLHKPALYVESDEQTSNLLSGWGYHGVAETDTGVITRIWVAG